MATTTFTTAAAGIATVEGLGYNVQCKPVTLTLSANVVAADVVQILKVPKNCTVLWVQAIASDMDTNGAPTMSFKIGDGDDDDYYVAASLIGQTGGVVQSNVFTARPKTYANDDTIDITWITAAATFAAGTIDVNVYYVTA
jgi:hypothetical protein